VAPSVSHILFDVRWADQIRRIRKATALLVRLAGCAALLLVSGKAISSAPPQGSPAPSPALGARFAIADFDGDLKPDLATVQVGGSNARTTHYSIRFDLSSGAARSISLVAPSGGLQIIPQDVNGDNIPDLIVSTQWLNRPVAVLLNDGHGNFTLTDPGAFPELMRNSQTEWSGAGTQIHDTAALPPSRSSAKACGVFAAAFSAGDDAELTPPSALRFHVVRFDLSCAGRAPPSAILHV
jgi:hypothetical protein